MQRQPILTKDGSHTILIPELNVTYHSQHGAIRESEHVFIEKGLIEYITRSKAQVLNVFEMGFGTGLNALLTLLYASRESLKVNYTAIDLYPLEPGQTTLLNYCSLLTGDHLLSTFEKLHESEWGSNTEITIDFKLLKLRESLQTVSINESQDLIYFDAFAPFAQPELWTKNIFDKMYSLLSPGGILVTYCSKGDVRRAMQAAGFLIEKLPGPPGKREMVRASKVR